MKGRIIKTERKGGVGEEGRGVEKGNDIKLKTLYPQMTTWLGLGQAKARKPGMPIRSPAWEQGPKDWVIFCFSQMPQ